MPLSPRTRRTLTPASNPEDSAPQGWGRNYPSPLPLGVHEHAGHSARNSIITEICEKINELQEYIFGLDADSLPVPAQSNIDARMPLMFLRPCVDALQRIIDEKKLPVPVPVQYLDNIDYHAFLPWTSDIKKCINGVIGQLGDKP